MNKEHIFSVANERYGEPSQGMMLATECGELIAELGRRYIQGRIDDEALAGELADVSLMIDQVLFIYGSQFKSNVEAIKIEKLHRLAKRLGINEQN